MHWNLIWKSHRFVQFGVQSDPLYSQTYHPWLCVSSLSRCNDKRIFYSVITSRPSISPRLQSERLHVTIDYNRCLSLSRRPWPVIVVFERQGCDYWPLCCRNYTLFHSAQIASFPLFKCYKTKMSRRLSVHSNTLTLHLLSTYQLCQIWIEIRLDCYLMGL